MTEIPEASVAKAMGVLAVHRWKTASFAHVECECGWRADRGQHESDFDWDVALRGHLARVVLKAVADDLRLEGTQDAALVFRAREQVAAQPTVDREALAQALHARFGYPTEKEWEELPQESREEWREDADALLATGVLTDAAQATVDRDALAEERDNWRENAEQYREWWLEAKRDAAQVCADGRRKVLEELRERTDEIEGIQVEGIWLHSERSIQAWVDDIAGEATSGTA